MSSIVPVEPATGSRSPAEIERELEQTRERLAANIDQLAGRVHPKAIAKRSTDKAKAMAADTAASATTAAMEAVVQARATAEEYAGKAVVLARSSLQRAKAELVDEAGDPRIDRVTAVASAAAAALLGLVAWRRRR